jgi:hypothetical protein
LESPERLLLGSISKINKNSFCGVVPTVNLTIDSETDLTVNPCISYTSFRIRDSFSVTEKSGESSRLALLLALTSTDCEETFYKVKVK